ncbi:MAG TPA: hypothetical protein VKX25_03775 [Bryobacteraceae bacterium]|nr:hypothetical protein [Bryobacteraceae bacterium]
MQLRRLLGLCSLLVSSSYAASVTGQLWTVSDSVAQNAVLANIPSTAPNVTFQANAPFNFTVAGTVDQWLLSGGATNITGSAADLSLPISPSILEFTGIVTVTTGETFTVTHDDGLTLQIGGMSVIDAPGPTGPFTTTQTYNGPSGTLPFTLVYGECCGGSAVLQIDLPFQSATPEPAPYAVVAGGLGVIALLRRRKLYQ